MILRFDGRTYGDSIQSSMNLGETLPNKGRMNNRTDLNLASLFIYQLSFISQFLDLIYLHCKSALFSEVTFCHFFYYLNIMITTSFDDFPTIFVHLPKI